MSIEWWYATACSHAEADRECGRVWQCACGPCSAAREAGHATEEALLRFGAKNITEYQRAMRSASDAKGPAK